MIVPLDYHHSVYLPNGFPVDTYNQQSVGVRVFDRAREHASQLTAGLFFAGTSLTEACFLCTSNQTRNRGS